MLSESLSVLGAGWQCVLVNIYSSYMCSRELIRLCSLFDYASRYKQGPWRACVWYYKRLRCAGVVASPLVSFFVCSRSVGHYTKCAACIQMEISTRVRERARICAPTLYSIVLLYLSRLNMVECALARVSVACVCVYFV